MAARWFPGEHKAIVDRATFDRVQQLLASKSSARKKKRSESGALLMGKLYDDKGNLMSPSYSSKNGVRYRFYVSSALLRGRKAAAGSISRIAAAEIEGAVLAALNTHQPESGSDDTPTAEMLERVVIAKDRLLITTSGTDGKAVREIKLKWSPQPKGFAKTASKSSLQEETRNKSLIQSIVRAHAWVRALNDETFASIELLATSAGLHPKVVRQELRLAFLTPEVTSAILDGRQPAGLSLAQIPKTLPLPWTEHRHLLG